MVKRLKELLFQNRDLRQTITKNVFWLSVSQVGNRLIRAVIIIYAARLLGTAEYGVFSYALSFAALFTVFADIGINQIITREVAKKPEQRTYYLSTAFWMKIFLFLITAALISVFIPYLSKVEKVAAFIPFIILIVIFDGLREFSLSFIRAREKMELEALTITLTSGAITIFGVLALYFSPTSQTLIFSYAAATGVGALAGIAIMRKEFGKIISHFDRNLIKPIIGSAWPITFNSILGAFMLNTDIIMLGWWRSPEEIGLYSASQRIIQVFYSLPAVLAGAIFPSLSRLISQNDKEKIKLLMEKGVTAVLLIAFPLVVGGVVIANPLIEFVYGKDYLATTAAFQALLISALVVFPGTIIGNAVLAHNQQKRMIAYTATAAFGNIIFNAILIPFYGIIGSAIATLLSQLTGNSLSWRMLKNINNFYILRHLKKIIAGAIIMGIFTFAFNKLGANVIINVIISAGVYFGVLYLFGEKTLDEVKIIFIRTIGK